MIEDLATELTAESVTDGSAPRDPVVSPDGRWVVYEVAAIGQAGERSVSHLWVAAVDRRTAPRRLTAGTTADRAPRWAPDSEAVFFLSDRAEDGTTQLHRIRLAGGDVDTLTAWSGGIHGHLPLSDPDLVALFAPDETTDEDRRRALERDDARVWGERVPLDRIRLLDLRTGEIRTPVTTGDRHAVEMTQRPRGGPLAVLTWATPDLDPGLQAPRLHLLELENETTHDLGPSVAQAYSLTWWQAEGAWHLAYLAVTPPGLVGGTAVFDVMVPHSGAAAVPRNLTEGMTACPLGLVQVASGPPLVVVADGLDTAVHRLDLCGLSLVEVARTEGLLTGLTASRSGDAVAALVSTAYEPVNVHAGPPEGPWERISDTRPEYRGIRWGTQERLSYKASDGLALDGLLILPAGKTRNEGPFPLVTLVHGGPDDRYADQFMLGVHTSGQWLATAGYAVFLPNPRGGQGHGHAFAASVAGSVGMAEWTDIVTGLDLLITDGVADPDRLGIGGWSHGGFMAAWAIGHTDRFRAGLMGAGISDWGMQAATGEYGAFESALGGSTGWEGTGPHRHDQLSPASFASKIRTPVLILHGEDDTNVSPGQAEYFHRALVRFRVEHEYVVYPREGHGIRERSHQLDLLRRTRDWFDRWLR